MNLIFWLFIMITSVNGFKLIRSFNRNPIRRIVYFSNGEINPVTDISLDHLTNNDSKLSPYWLNQIKLAINSKTRDLIPQLVPDNALGFEPTATKKGGSIIKGDSLLQYTIDQKNLHPDKVILMRSGDFYETYGVDALMLVAYCGLNPMGNKCKAGCPVKNVQATLDGLTSHGLSAAVYEELPQLPKDLQVLQDSEPKKKKKSKKTNDEEEPIYNSKLKRRAFTQIVSPASRTYFYDLSLRSDDIEFPENLPIVGIMKNHHGYLMCQIYLDEQQMAIRERLTEEAVRIFLSSSRAINPIYIQDAQDLDFLKVSNDLEILQGQNEQSFPKHLLHLIQEKFEINTSKFYIVNEPLTQRPRPIYTSTALQIGLLPNPNVPDLIKSLLPEPRKAISEHFLRNWLLNPPPYDIANHMQTLCLNLRSSTESIPPFQALAVGKVMSLLREKQGNVPLFRDLHINLKSISQLLSRYLLIQEKDIKEQTLPEVNFLQWMDAMIAITSYASGIPVNIQELHKKSQDFYKLIEQTINYEYKEDKIYQDPFKNIPENFFKQNEETFRNKLNTQHPLILQTYPLVESLAQDLSFLCKQQLPNSAEVVFDSFENSLIFSHSNGGKSTVRSKRNIKSNPDEGVEGESTSKLDPQIEFIPYIDRKGKQSTKRFTTKELTDKVREYLDIVESFPSLVSQILQELSETIDQDRAIVLQTSYFAVILQSVLSHVISSVQKGWQMPQLEDLLDSSSQSDLLSMKFEGLTPYWLSRLTAIPNSGQLKGTFLLTAPNMSGKSTLMRSLLVLALLGNSGLFVPAINAKIPRYDTFFLRTASYDIPSEAKSAFALEMDDMRVMLRDSSDRSLIMVDELGKGTSAKDGSSLAGALLEHIDNYNISCIFATHLHELFSLPLSLKNVQYKRMGYQIDDSNGKIQWSYLLEDGQCLDSMALVTAKHYGIRSDILHRAKHLSELYDKIFQPRDFSEQRNDSQSYQPLSRNYSTPLSLNSNNIDKLSLTSDNLQELDLPSESSFSLESDFLPILRSQKFDDLREPIVYIPPNHSIPASLEGKSAVYILYLTSTKNPNKPGSFYVGETESLNQRIGTHRSNAKRSHKEISALVMNVANKSDARKLETTLILWLKEQGYHLDRSADAKHVLFSQGLSP